MITKTIIRLQFNVPVFDSQRELFPMPPAWFGNPMKHLGRFNVTNSIRSKAKY